MFERYLKTDIEQATIGALLNNPKLAFDYNVKEDYFLHPDNKNIINAILKLIEERKPVSPMEVCRQDKNIGLDYVLDLLKTYPSFDIGTHIKFLKQNAENFDALCKLKAVLDDAEDKDVEVYQELNKIIQERPLETIKADFKQDLIANLERKMKNGGKLEGVLSGINDFDEVINGFNNGRLYICGARSSMGKSAFMCSCLDSMTETIKAGVISLEMTSGEIAQRIVCIRSKIPYWVIDKGRANDSQFEKFCEGVNQVKNIIIDDTGGLNCADVCFKIRQMVKSGCKIVFIDHLGLIRVNESKQNLAYLIGQITATLKSLSKELNIPIVCLAQVNRGVEKAVDNRPKLSDLRDSGRIEEDADSVFFLYRPDYYKNESQARYETGEIIVAKNRNGECKIVNTVFDNQTMKWGG